MAEVGPLTLTTRMDTGNFDSEMDSLNRRLERAEGEGEELNTVFENMGGILDGLTQAAKGIGLGLVGFMSSAVAMSPQLKKMFAKLHPIMFRLGNYLGRELEPIFQKLIQGARGFVNELIAIDQEYGIMESLAETGPKMVEWTFNVAGSLENFLFGTEDKRGLVDMMDDLEGGLESTFNITVDADDKTLATLSAGAYLTGHPMVGGVLASFLVGKNVQESVGSPKGGGGFPENTTPFQWPAYALGNLIETFSDKHDIPGGKQVGQGIEFISENPFALSPGFPIAQLGKALRKGVEQGLRNADFGAIEMD